MGDRRFAEPYRMVYEASDRAAAIAALSDERVIAALANAHVEHDRVLLNVLATEAMNRVGRNSALVENAFDGLIALDQEGRVVAVNPAAGAMLAWSRANLRGALFHPTIHRAGQTRDCPIMRLARSGGALRGYETRFTRRDGDEFLVEVNAQGYEREGQHTGCVLSFRDVSHRLRQRETEERYRSLFEQAPEAIFAIDEGGNFLGMNEKAEHLSGFSGPELLGAPFAPLLAEEELPLALERFAEVLSGRTREDPYTLVRKDGARVRVSVLGMPIVVSGRVVGMHGRARALDPAADEP